MLRIAPVLLLFPVSVVAQSWTQLPNFPGTARDDAAAFNIGQFIYVGTGMQVGWGLTNDWWRYDVYGIEWQQIASLPTTPRQYCTAIGSGDKGYLFGGVDSNGVLNELWEYDPVQDQWTQLPSLPANPRYACAGWQNGSSIYIATGMMDTGMPTNEFWEFERISQTWDQLDDVPGPARHRSAYFGTSELIILGGADEASNALLDAYAYDISMTGASWAPFADLPAPRYGADASPQVVIAGASSGSEFHSDVWARDASSSDWITLPSFPGGTRRGGVSSSFCCLGHFVFYGTGLDAASVRRNDWWALEFPSSIAEEVHSTVVLQPNPGSSSFSIVGLAPSPHHVQILDPQGRSIHLHASTLLREFDTSTWDSGVYWVNIVDAHGHRSTTPFIKLP